MKRLKLGLTRRNFLRGALGWAALLCGRLTSAATRDLEPTPACGEPSEPTPRQTAGPFFKPSSPERQSLLEPGIHGTKIILEGRVRSTRCAPISGALLDFWQADASGAYDNAGFRLRGHQFADSQGRYRLETIVPGLYPGRTRHFHVRVQAPNRPALTTQLYFPGEPENRRDGIFNSKLLMTLRESAGGKTAAFDFALDVT